MSERGGSPGDDARFLQAVIESLPDAMTLSTAVRDAAGRAVDMRLDYMNAKAREGQPDAQAAIGGLCSELWPGMVENGSFAACMRVLDLAVQVHGGMGFMNESEVNRLYRSGKVLEIGAGTTQVRQLIVAGELLKRAAQG